MMPRASKEVVLMNKLVQSLKDLTHTENMSLTYSTSGSEVLNLFATGGALRTRSAKGIISIFEKAFKENIRLSLRCLFYLRDIRGGQGERRTFREILRWLSENHPDYVKKNLENVFEFGRWDDLFIIEGTPVWPQVLKTIREQLDEDIGNLRKGKSISLLAKWLPSINASSKKSRKLALRLAYALGINPAKYRKTLSALRKKMDVVERKLSSQDWSDINYETVPSKASMNYRNAFERHDEKRYQEYIADVYSGKKKINASTLFPYEIVEKVLYGKHNDSLYSMYENMVNGKGENSATLEVLWKNQPDYLKGNRHNGLVVADVSGSMSGRPMATSIAMAMYFAERTEGEFKNSFITFSNEPEFIRIEGNTLFEKVQFISTAPWGMNTNLQAVFDMILKRGRMYNVPQEDMPDTIYIISDMEFDQATRHQTNYEAISELYEQMGYQKPILVFWNVNARHNHFPVQMNEEGVVLVSGSSPSAFEMLLSGEIETPYEHMQKVLLQERYDRVAV